MKKFFKYLGISILIIFGLMIVFIEDQTEKDVDNFFTIPILKTGLVEKIKMVETFPAESLQNDLDKFITKLENKYPNNPEVQSLRNSLNEAIVLQKEYAIKWEKDIEERVEREMKMAKQEAINKKPIAIKAICSTQNDAIEYMSGMENLRQSAAIQYIKDNNNCYLADDPKSYSDTFTRNSVVRYKGWLYLVLFNGDKYGATKIEAYENP